MRLFAVDRGQHLIDHLDVVLVALRVHVRAVAVEPTLVRVARAVPVDQVRLRIVFDELRDQFVVLIREFIVRRPRVDDEDLLVRTDLLADGIELIRDGSVGGQGEDDRREWRMAE